MEALAKSLDTRALKNLAIFGPAVTRGPCNKSNISVQFFFILQCVKSDIVLPWNLQVAVRLTAVCWAGPPAYDVPDLQHKSLGLTPGSKFDYFLDYLAPCCWNKTVFDKEWSMLSQLFTMLGCVSSSTQLPSGLFHVHWVAHLTQAAPPSPSCPHTPWCVPSKFHYGQEHAPHFW